MNIPFDSIYFKSIANEQTLAQFFGLKWRSNKTISPRRCPNRRIIYNNNNCKYSAQRGTKKKIGSIIVILLREISKLTNTNYLLNCNTFLIESQISQPMPFIVRRTAYGTPIIKSAAKKKIVGQIALVNETDYYLVSGR